MSKQDNILQHIADIDFRTKEERQRHALDDFKGWYDALYDQQLLSYSDLAQAQLTLLSSILWYLMPDKEYKKFLKRKPVVSAPVL